MGSYPWEALKSPVRSDRTPRRNRAGSGYRITGGTVLTASHGVLGAARVGVRCNADTPEEWTLDACVLGQDGDFAALAVDRSDELTPVRYGRVPERDAVIACTGLGFPRFTPRGDASDAYRDLCHLAGSAPVLSNRRSETLAITVTSPPEPDPDPALGLGGEGGDAGLRGGPPHRRRHELTRPSPAVRAGPAAAARCAVDRPPPGRTSPR
jgi:hypothetical protein